MSRDQRVRDNWALLHARELALRVEQPLLVVFCLVPGFLGAALRQYGFMLRGLAAVQEVLAKKGIPFSLLRGDPTREIPAYVNKQKAGILVTDFDPLRIKRGWKDRLTRVLPIPFLEVDAHNIVPPWIASPKQEYGARTLRPKINRLLREFLVPFPRLKAAGQCPLRAPRVEWEMAWRSLRVDRTVREVDWILPGERPALRALRSFVDHGLEVYDRRRNDPALDGQSSLSPYLHFGHLSAQRAPLAVINAPAPEKAKAAFLEELIVRRELSDNFCFYNDSYDQTRGLPRWGHATLSKHARDRRDHVYSLRELEESETSDPLWNAAQKEMVKRGKMHGYLRMYWAKKILEWSRGAEEALEHAIHLNDRYELDGRDPNGYAGIAWAIGGLHDRPWPERRIFGTVRSMSYEGCRRKFNVQAYIRKVETL
jgi:deoxyribodipyrimidine photo-lyase